MSYDLGLKDPATNEWMELDNNHHMKGGTYCLGGSTTAEINITYNYSAHYDKVFETTSGIRSIYGKTGVESMPIITRAISLLGDDVSNNYWEPTEGNAKKALIHCLALAKLCPDGIWDGD